MVHYYQQVGRALDEAYGILLGGKEDKEITDYFIRTAFPPQAHIDVVIEALNQADDAKRSESGQGAINRTLKFLAVETTSPVTKIGSKWI